MQDYSQININYGEAVAEIIKSNCNVHIFLGTENQKTKEEFSTRCGQTSVETKSANGKKVVKAGTPIGSTGVVDNTATVVGILLHDVTEDRPQGTLLKKAYIKTAVAQAHSGVTIDTAVKTALPMVVFE